MKDHTTVAEGRVNVVKAVGEFMINPVNVCFRFSLFASPRDLGFGFFFLCFQYCISNRILVLLCRSSFSTALLLQVNDCSFLLH